MEVAARLEGIGEYYFSQKLRELDALNKQGRNVINLGIGSPDLPPHPDVIKMLSNEAAKSTSHAYQSYKGSPLLRNAISGWYKRWYDVVLDPELEILPLIGSKEGIMHVCMTYLNQGDEVLVPNPGYPTYRSAVQLAGGSCIDYDLSADNSFYPDLKDLGRTDLSKVKMMFINYPQMPTGQKAERLWFEKMVQFARLHNILLVHDNPYSFILNDRPLSILGIPGAKDCAIELNSLSKSHNMAGWRVGMLCGAEKRINEVLRFKSNMDSGMFLPVQLAAVKALELGMEWYEGINKTYRERREKVYQLLKQLKCEYSTDQAGLFVWSSIPPGYKDGYAFSDDVLKKYAVFITPGGIFGSNGNNYIRVSLCSKAEKLEEAIERLQSLSAIDF